MESGPLRAASEAELLAFAKWFLRRVAPLGGSGLARDVQAPNVSALEHQPATISYSQKDGHVARLFL
ncbi:hypothetical protein DPMN_114502 [Dreissena polymorpha]|uniref:Uncharacterized protein n=1 Tax=Dreissena polymorpha TaxID=45954 RepID=A0A9D4KJK8_DREPO|nr:hypothetical protein DPMN_114502 [Dreissena polymorpha]